MIGVLATIVIIAILGVIIMTAMKGTMGGGNTPVQQNQATTAADRMNIQQIGQTLMTWAASHNGRLPAPSMIVEQDDRKDLDTSANFWASLVAQDLVHGPMLISHNERNFNVEEYTSYFSYSPATGQYWDPNFKADLHTISHVSFAHEALYGDRYRRNWTMSAPSWFPILGNRGPKDGVNNLESLACDASGVWAGDLFYGDGHVQFHRNPTAAGGNRDNIFSIESLDGEDAIITFTKEIWNRGFEPQWD